MLTYAQGEEGRAVVAADMLEHLDDPDGSGHPEFANERPLNVCVECSDGRRNSNWLAAPCAAAAAALPALEVGGGRPLSCMPLPTYADVC